MCDNFDRDHSFCSKTVGGWECKCATGYRSKFLLLVSILMMERLVSTLINAPEVHLNENQMPSVPITLAVIAVIHL